MCGDGERKKKSVRPSRRRRLPAPPPLSPLSSLPPFPPSSRLCILKGIHPREPRKKPHGRHRTYYHAKDIGFLAHEPLLARFREDVALERRVRRARAKGNPAAADRLAASRPAHRLDHLVRERYPTLADALRDLDDPLTLVHLFAALASDERAHIPRAATAAARALAL